MYTAGLPLVPLLDGSLHTLQEAPPSATQAAYIGDALDARLLGSQLPGMLVDCELLNRETADRCLHVVLLACTCYARPEPCCMHLVTNDPIDPVCKRACTGPASGIR